MTFLAGVRDPQGIGEGELPYKVTEMFVFGGGGGGVGLVGREEGVKTLFWYLEGFSFSRRPQSVSSETSKTRKCATEATRSLLGS